MAKYRTVTGTIEKAVGTAWADADVLFVLRPGSTSPTPRPTTFPSFRKRVRTESDGSFEVELWANAEAETGSEYICELPGGEVFSFILPVGTAPIDIAELRTLYAGPSSPPFNAIRDVITEEIGVESAAREAADTAEAATRAAADTAHANAIALETSTRAAADAAETAARQAADVVLTNTINGEANVRANADALLQADIAAEAAARAAAVTAEATARGNADAVIQAALDLEETARASADNTLTVNLAAEIADRESAVDAEATARQAAVDLLQLNIDTEETARADADTAEATARNNADVVQAAGLVAETNARTAADTAESTARTNADTALQTNITAEATSRANADAAEATARAAADAAHAALVNNPHAVTAEQAGAVEVDAVAFQGPSEAADVDTLRNEFNSLIDRLVLAGVMRGGSWNEVAVPAGFGWTPPFSIYRTGERTFAVSPSFNMREYAGIVPANTYYVDKANGDSSDTGLDWGHALAHINTAIAKAGAKTVYVKAGYYYRNECVTLWNTDIELIAVDGDVYFTNDVGNQIGAWTLVGNHYEATLSGGYTVGLVADESNLDAHDMETVLTAQASSAAVDANANSWFQSGTTLYVRTVDGRAPDVDVHFYDSPDITAGVLSVARTSGAFYAEGIHFRRKAQFSKGAGAGDLKGYLKNCTGVTFTVNGLTEIIYQNVKARGSTTEDCFPYFTQNGITPKAVEIDCEGYDNGNNGIDQGSTTHTGCHIIRINGKYHHNNGQNCADVDAALTWMLGSEIYNSAGSGFYTAGVAWLDSIWSHDQPNYDLQNAVGATIYTRNCTLEKGVNNIAGTLASY